MKNTQKPKLFEANANSEIIDDAGLIQCINRLNSLKETGSEVVALSNDTSVAQPKDVPTDINRIRAEMRWFSQWLTAKVNSAA